MKTESKTKQQLLLEMEELRTRLDAAERRLQEANELLQAQIAESKRVSETRWRIEGKDGAAAILGLHPSTLRARMRKLGILRSEPKDSD